MSMSVCVLFVAIHRMPTVFKPSCDKLITCNMNNLNYLLCVNTSVNLQQLHYTHFIKLVLGLHNYFISSPEY